MITNGDLAFTARCIIEGKDIVTAIAAIVGALALLAPTFAHAEIKACNEFREPVFVAIGWVENGNTSTQGWWQVNTGQCVTVDTRPLRSPHYFHAETRWRSDGRGHKVQHSWGGGRTLKVSSVNFKYVRAQKIDSDDRRVEFEDLSAKVSGYKSVTYVIKADGKRTEKKYRVSA